MPLVSSALLYVAVRPTSAASERNQLCSVAKTNKKRHHHRDATKKKQAKQEEEHTKLCARTPDFIPNGEQTPRRTTRNTKKTTWMSMPMSISPHVDDRCLPKTEHHHHHHQALTTAATKAPAAQAATTNYRTDRSPKGGTSC